MSIIHPGFMDQGCLWQGPLLELAPRLAGYCAPGGLLALSGILATQAPAVQAAYAPYFSDFLLACDDGDWALLTAVRREGRGEAGDAQ